MIQNLKKWFFLGTLNLVMVPVYAVPCVITIIKNTCWLDYQIHAEIHDRNTGKNLAEVVIPKNQSWARVQFDAKVHQVIAIQASFSPAIFTADAGRFYQAGRFWMMPGDQPVAGSIWAFDVCFDKDFVNAPMPTHASGNCVCDTSRIPAIVPQEMLVK